MREIIYIECRKCKSLYPDWLDRCDNCKTKFLFGSDKGNQGAIIRWGGIF